MKSFYIKIFLFLLPALVVWSGLEIFYRSTETNYTFKHKKLVERSDDVETLILGNSHALYGINPRYFNSETLNISNISQSLYFDELILEKHLDDLNNLKAVVLTISYFSLSQQDDASEDLWRKYFYSKQMKLEVPTISEYDIKNYSLALTRRFNKSVELVKEYADKETIITCDSAGYGLQDESNIVDDKEGIAQLIAKKHEDNSMDFLNNIERLKRIISKCDSKNVKVILVEMPVYKTYYDLLNPIKKEKIISTCNLLTEENDNVYYLKLSQHPDFLSTDLRDADHLTNEGAKKCSVVIDSFIEEIFLKK